jgi:hypothetical protein
MAKTLISIVKELTVKAAIYNMLTLHKRMESDDGATERFCKAK